jgi:precorrin-6A/cobalt-precorrin-6A reductase
LVTLGRTELAPLTRAPQHFYLIRSVDPVEPPLALPCVSYRVERGPFSETEDRALMRAHAIDTVIAKNSGGTASYGKVAAARALGIEVIMLRRPAPPEGPAVETVDEMVACLDHAIASAMARGLARGV